MDYTVMETQLKDEYRRVFSDAVLYGTMKNIPEDIFDEKMSELYDLLITAESENKPVQKLVGKDSSKFLKSFFGDLTIWDRLKAIPTSLYNVAWVVFVLECIEMFAADEPLKNFFTVRSDISGYGIGLITALLMYFITSSVLAPIFLKNRKGKNNEGLYFLIIAIFVVLIGLGVYFFNDISLLAPTHAFIFASGFYIAVYLIVRSVWRLKNYGSLRNTRKQIEQDSYYKNLQNKDMEKAILKGWQARYDRLVKKGKTTEEEYLGKLQKEEKLQEKLANIVTPLVFVAVVGFFVIDVAKDSTWYDTLLFAALECTIVYFISRWIIRSEKKQSAVRCRMLSECESENKTLPEYINERLSD